MIRTFAIFPLVLLTALSFSQSGNPTVSISDILIDSIIENSFDHFVTAEKFVERGKKAYVIHLYDSSLYYLNIAEKLNSKINDPRLEADIDYHFGRAYYYQNQNQKAIPYFQKAIQYRNFVNDYEGLAEGYNALGVAYKHVAKYSDAIRAFNLANKFYHFTNDSTGIGLVELNVGNILKNLGKTALAKQKYQNAIDIFIETKNESNVASCYNNLGNLYKNENMLDSAFYYMYKTMQLRRKEGSAVPLSYIYHNLANLHSRNNNYDSALFYIQASIEIKSKIDNPVLLAGDYDSYGSIYEAQKKWKDAIYYYEKARNLTVEDSFTENGMELANSLAICYYFDQQYRKSADEFIRYFEIRDSLKSLNSSYLVQDELIKYEYFTDSIRNEQLTLQKELQQTINEKDTLQMEAEQKRYFFVVIILGLLLLMIVFLFVSARRRLQQTREHQKILADQNEELQRTLISKEEKEILLKEVHHRVKNNLQIISSLIRLQSSFMNKGNFQEKLVETENRIRSMALIHEKLYKSDSLSSLSIRNYIEELSIHISESYDNDLKVRFNIDVEEREYRIDSLIPLGLIINEILSNSLKYAFYGRNHGTVSIVLKSDEEHTYLTVYDDGMGADLSLDELKEGSLGIDLIISLTDQLDGELHLDTTSGFRYEFIFPLLN